MEPTNAIKSALAEHALQELSSPPKGSSPKWFDGTAGVTAAFNLDLPARPNAGPAPTAPGCLPSPRLVEMHLESLPAQEVRIAGRATSFASEDLFHTENSHKFTT